MFAMSQGYYNTLKFFHVPGGDHLGRERDLCADPRDQGDGRERPGSLGEDGEGHR
jgi:hypothetical protein